MAPRPNPSSPASFYASVSALCDDVDSARAAIAVLQQTLSNTQSAISKEVADRDFRINDAARVLRDSITSLSDLLGNRLDAETRGRASAVGGEREARQSAIQAQADALQQAVARLEGLIAQKPDPSALQETIAEVNAALAAITAWRLDFVPDRHRPGDCPLSFTPVSSTYALGGLAKNLPLVPGSLVQAGDNGLVARLTGTAILGMRRAAAIEAGRVYRARFVVERRNNPSDPSGDAIQFGLTCLDQSFAVLPGADGVRVITRFDDLRTGDGRREVQVIFSRSPGDNIQVTVSNRTRAVRAYVRTFGPDGITDVEVLDIEDVTSATVLPAVSADVIARLTTLEEEDLGARLDAIEAQVSGPASVTFKSKSDAAAATIPESAETVRLLGSGFQNDGRAGTFKRSAGTPPAGADTFTSGGVPWVRVYVADDLLTVILREWFYRLPTVPPDDPHMPWNDGDVLHWTPAS